MAWEDHPELVHAPGDGYDPRTDYRYDDTEQHDDEGGELIMGEMAEWYLEQNEAEANRDRMARRIRVWDPPIQRLDEMRSVLAEAARANGSERFGSQPPIGTVLRWTGPGRYGKGVVLTYLAVRVSDGMWFTSINGQGRSSWRDIVSLVGNNPCSVATAWTEIPAPEPEPRGDDQVAAWASQFRRVDAEQADADERGDLDS